MNWTAFFHSLVAAAVGGAATSITVALSDPLHADWNRLAPAAVAGALIGVAALLKQSPLPPTPPPGPKNNTPNFPEPH